jgi:hypothetical protein
LKNGPDDTEDMIRFYKNELFLNISFCLLIVVLLISRTWLLLDLNINFIDLDMPFMWAGLSDYAQGLFYEPRFYGQDYNTFMEPLLAVPLYWMNVPVYYALPAATHFVALFPFLFTSGYLFSRGHKENALLVLCLLLCLAPGFHVMTSLPRGVSGVFFTSFFVLSVFNPTRLSFIVLNTFLSVLAYFVTPNAVVVSIPMLAFLFLHNCKNPRYYIATGLCLLSAIPLYLFFDKFYKDHPDYIIYGLSLFWSADYFLEAIQQLDLHFAHISFLTEEKPFLVYLVFLFLPVALFRKQKKAFLAYLAFIAIMLVSLFSSKVSQGTVWPFYSFSRMFIGVPMAFVLFSLFLPLHNRLLVALMVVFTLGYSIFRLTGFKESIAYHTEEKRWDSIYLVSLKTVKESARAFAKVCKTQKVDFMLISNSFWLCTYLNYGGVLINPEFPSSEETQAERRYWVREANQDRVFKRFLFLSVDYNFDQSCPFKEVFQLKRLDDYGMFLVENNTVKHSDFIAIVNKYEKR